MAISSPIVYKIEDNPTALERFESVSMQQENEKKKRIIALFPTVYIHNWRDTDNYEVYIGESNNIFQRTRQHFDNAEINPESWQKKMLDKKGSLYIIGHEHFNKSLTLDIENKLMHYMLSVPKIKKVHNLRGNPQREYYPCEELEPIFSKIWQNLRGYDKELFPTENYIRDSAIFKASPLHKLTDDQIQARNKIIDCVLGALKNNRTGQICFVEGEAGTGKTVLNSSTFYEILCQAEEEFGEVSKEIKCALIVNHDEQITVYNQIADKLGLTDKYGEVVYKPTRFINTHNSGDPVDVAFIDEAHLLWTQGKQSYQGENQLQDILERAKVTVVMFDENQILTTEEIWEKELLERYREKARNSGTYIELRNQLRIHADKEIIQWIDAFTKEQKVLKIPTTSDYSLKIFDSPVKLDKEICKKAKNTDTALSRLIATYDWEYSTKKKQADRIQKYWEVVIDHWHKPWNRELERELSVKDKKKNKKLSWAEQEHTIHEVGSTFTIQGFDLNYAGVILGPSVTYRNGQIVFDPGKSYNSKAVQNRTLSNGRKQKFAEELLKHEVRVLMTRGVNGLYIYACDKELRDALLNAAKREN